MWPATGRLLEERSACFDTCFAVNGWEDWNWVNGLRRMACRWWLPRRPRFTGPAAGAEALESSRSGAHCEQNGPGWCSGFLPGNTTRRVVHIIQFHLAAWLLWETAHSAVACHMSAASKALCWPGCCAVAIPTLAMELRACRSPHRCARPSRSPRRWAQLKISPSKRFGSLGMS